MINYLPLFYAGEKIMGLKRFLGIVALFLLWINLAFAGGGLKDIYGRTIPLSSLKGKWVYINYWASWCHPCVEEIPHLNSFYKRYKSSNVVMFGVNFDAVSLKEQQFLAKKFGLRYPSLGQDPARALNLGNIRGVPVTFVINPEGKLVEALYGSQTVNSLKNAMT